MAFDQVFPCPHCGFSYSLSGDYLQQYGGQQTACTACGQSFTLPAAHSIAPAPAPAQLAYAAPEMAAQEQAEGLWQDGADAVISRGLRLPPRCMKCNVAVLGKPRHFRMKTSSDRIYVRGGLASTAVVNFMNRKFVEMHGFLCPSHLLQYKLGRHCGTLLILFGMIMSFVLPVLFGTYSPTGKGPYLGLSIGAGIILGGAVWKFIADPFSVKRVNGRYAWIRGFGRPFLKTLPAAK